MSNFNYTYEKLRNIFLDSLVHCGANFKKMSNGIIYTDEIETIFQERAENDVLLFPAWADSNNKNSLFHLFSLDQQQLFKEASALSEIEQKKQRDKLISILLSIIEYRKDKEGFIIYNPTRDTEHLGSDDIVVFQQEVARRAQLRAKLTDAYSKLLESFHSHIQDELIRNEINSLTLQQFSKSSFRRAFYSQSENTPSRWSKWGGRILDTTTLMGVAVFLLGLVFIVAGAPFGVGLALLAAAASITALAWLVWGLCRLKDAISNARLAKKCDQAWETTYQQACDEYPAQEQAHSPIRIMEQLGDINPAPQQEEVVVQEEQPHVFINPLYKVRRPRVAPPTPQFPDVPAPEEVPTHRVGHGVPDFDL